MFIIGQISKLKMGLMNLEKNEEVARNERLLGNLIECYGGMLVRNVPENKVVSFITQVFSREELSALTGKSTTFISQIKHSKRIWNEEDQKKIYNFYKTISEMAIDSEYYKEEPDPINSQALYTVEDVREIESELTIFAMEHEKLVTKFKQKVRSNLRSTKKNVTKS